jgi:hypothetical protein
MVVAMLQFFNDEVLAAVSNEGFTESQNPYLRAQREAPKVWDVIREVRAKALRNAIGSLSIREHAHETFDEVAGGYRYGATPLSRPLICFDKHSEAVRLL